MFPPSYARKTEQMQDVSQKDRFSTTLRGAMTTSGELFAHFLNL